MSLTLSFFHLEKNDGLIQRGRRPTKRRDRGGRGRRGGNRGRRGRGETVLDVWQDQRHRCHQRHPLGILEMETIFPRVNVSVMYTYSTF